MEWTKTKTKKRGEMDVLWEGHKAWNNSASAEFEIYLLGKRYRWKARFQTRWAHRTTGMGSARTIKRCKFEAERFVEFAKQLSKEKEQ